MHKEEFNTCQRWHFKSGLKRETMCNSTKGTVTNPAFRKWKDTGRKTEFLPYPLTAARSKTQMLKKKKKEPIKHIKTNNF